MSEKQHSCLVTTDDAQIPLEGVRIDARLSGVCSEVTVTQRYHNAETRDVEAVYVFPLEEGSAVCGFTARIGERVIRGQVEERERAFEIYDDAMAAGHGAFLMDQERPNVFTVSVGNLKPGQTIDIAITYVARLNFEGASVRLMIPTTVSPRYVPSGPPQVGEPDGDRVNPPAGDEVPYGLTLNVEIGGSRPRMIDSPSHPVRTTFTDTGASVTLSNDETALDRDFVLLVQPEAPHRPEARVAREADGTLCAMVTFHPDPTGMANPGNEVLFLLDCSGSMQGDSIEQAKRALALCVRALGEADTFNIVRFGSSYQSLWPSPRPYGQASLDEATRYIQGVHADLGGTEILAPLDHLLRMPADGKRSRQVLLLTDGEVGNEADVIELCKRFASSARVFAFGIGAGASEHLVRGVARASRAAAEFIYPGERIEPKVLRMFGRINSPSFKNVTVDWRGLEVEQAPLECPAVFGGDSLTVFGRIRGGAAESVVLHADEHTWEVPLDLTHAEAGGPIPTLWARTAIRDLEAGHGAPARGSNQARGRSPEDRKAQKLLELGKRYGLMSSATSYVAVEERNEADKTPGQAELRKVPVAITKGWHGRGSVGSRSMTKAGGGAGMVQAAAFLSKSMSFGSAAASMAPPPPPRSAPGAPMPVSSGAPPRTEAQDRYAVGAPFEDLDDSFLLEEAMPADEMEYADYGESSGAAPEPEAAEEERARGISLFGRVFRRDKEKAERKEAKPPAPKRAAPARAAAPSDAPVGQAISRFGRTAATPAAAQADRVFELLMTQKADGSFGLSATLRDWLGPRAAAVQAAADADGEALVATAVAVALLRAEAADRRDEWTPAVAKALRWLALHGRTVDVEKLLRG